MEKYRLPKGWELKLFPDMVNNTSAEGGRVQKKAYLESGKYPVIDQGQEIIGGFTNKKDMVINSDKPLVVWGDHTTLAKFIDYPFASGADGTKVFYTKDALFPKWLFYYLNWIDYPDLGYSRHYRFLREQEIPLPPLAEQKRIVAKLDDLIGKAQEAVRLRREAVEEVDAIFYSVLKRILHSEDINLPTGWHWFKLGDKKIIEIIMGQSPPGNTYNMDCLGLPFMQGKTEFGALSPKPIKWCSEPKKIAINGDTLLCVRAPVGPVNLCNDRICIGRGLAAIRANKGLESKYLFYWLKSYENKWKGQGSTFQAISATDIRNSSIPIPSLSEQKHIVTYLDNLQSKVDELRVYQEETQAELDALIPSVLDRAFRGEL